MIFCYRLSLINSPTSGGNCAILDDPADPAAAAAAEASGCGCVGLAGMGGMCMVATTPADVPIHRMSLHASWRQLYKNRSFRENRFSETIFKRIGLPKDLFSYEETVFREDLFLYNSSQGRDAQARRLVLPDYVVAPCNGRRRKKRG